MPIIKLWCLPKFEETKLREIHKAVVLAVASIKELCLRDENDMTVLFPPDMMTYGLGNEVIVEVTIFEKPERHLGVMDRLAQVVGITVQTFVPDAKIEVLIHEFNPVLEGFWTSASPT